MITQNIFRVKKIEIEKEPHKIKVGGWAIDLLIHGENETLGITLFSDYKTRLNIKKVKAVMPF